MSGIAVPSVGDKISALEPELTALDAIAAATTNIGGVFNPEQHEPLGRPQGAERCQSLTPGDTFELQVRVRLIYFLVSSEDVRLVWEVIAGLRGNPFTYQVLVDATNGDILLRENLTSDSAPYWLAYFDVHTTSPVSAKSDYQPLDSPEPLSPGPARPNGAQGVPVSAVLLQANGDESVSERGWLKGGETRTTGNNVVAFVNIRKNGKPDAKEQPVATTAEVSGTPKRTFKFSANFAEDPEKLDNRNAATVNVFVIANWWHDRMADLGFTEEAGNFQQTDSSGDGGGDPIQARFHVDKNNARFDTTVRGRLCCPQLKSGIFTGTDPDRDSSFDAEILVHEFTYGLSNRIIGGPNTYGLSKPNPRGIGEGYSDLYSLLLLRQPDKYSHGIYSISGYSTLHFTPQTSNWKNNYYFGIRHFPYSTNLCVNPFTLVDMKSSAYDIKPIPIASCDTTPPVSPWLAKRFGGVHDMGEIWAVMVWEARRNLVEKHGAALGNELMIQLLTDSLYLLPRDPTFVEARDAILTSDLARTGGENQCQLWNGFAKRGMGVDALTSPIGQFVEHFAPPEQCNKQQQDPDEGSP